MVVPSPLYSVPVLPVGISHTIVRSITTPVDLTVKDPLRPSVTSYMWCFNRVGASSLDPEVCDYGSQ